MATSPDEYITLNRRGRFIIKNSVVDNIYSSYDYLKSNGRIRSVGFTKFLDNESLGGKFKRVINNKETTDLIMKSAWETISGEVIDKLEDIYD